MDPALTAALITLITAAAGLLVAYTQRLRKQLGEATEAVTVEGAVVARLSALEAEVHELRAERDAASAQIQRLSHELTVATGEVERLRAQIEVLSQLLVRVTGQRPGAPS